MSTKADRNLLVDAWKGATVVCIASGALPPEQVERVRLWHQLGSGVVVVVNTTFETCPWADVVYAMDKRWWMFYWESLDKNFKGIRVSRAEMIQRYKILTLHDFNAYNNSGAGAISLAARGGAKKIVLIGYSLKTVDGQQHHHGDHPKGLGNAKSMHKWPEAFQRLRKDLDKKGIEYVNCTTDTLLDWPWEELDNVLQLG